MKKINLINSLIIFCVSVFSLIYLFLGDYNISLYKILIIISVIPVMLIPTILNKIFKINPKIQLLYLIFIFFGYFLGSILNFYGAVPFYDKVIHGLSGVMSSILALLVLIKSNSYDKNPLWVKIIFILCITLSIAACWEFFEFTSDIIFGKDAQNVITTGVNDTMLDMLMAFIGSICFCIYYVLDENTKNKFISKIK